MVIHLIHHPVSAKKFVEPIVKLLNSHGVEAELWIENREEFKDFISAIDCPKSFAKFDLSLNLFSVLVRLVRLLKRFVRLRPTAIHAHQTRAAFIPLFAALLARVPIRIYHNDGTPYLGYRGPLRALGRVNRETSRFFDVPDAIFRNENSRGNQIRPYAGSKSRQNHNIDNIRFSRCTISHNVQTNYT